jgi:peptide deformylase
MTILPIIIAPDPILERVADPVDEVNAEIQKTIDNMIETMRHEQGAGLAAPQVGISKRIFLMDISSYYKKEMPLYVVINPEFTYMSEETWVEAEGCLSIPVGARIPVERPEKIRMKYLDYHGNQQEITADGWLARGFLHENDHLDGITGLNYLSSLKKDLMVRKLNKYKKHNEQPAPKHDL